MLIESLILAGSLAIIIKGGDLFVSASVRIAELARIPHVVIGSTLVSLATTSPELVVSIVSGLEGESELAMGNAIGSCLCNMGLILGAMALIKQIEIRIDLIRVPLIAMVALGVTVFALTMDLRITTLQGTLLLLGGAAYFLYDFWRHSKDTSAESAIEALIVEQDSVAHRGFLATGFGASLQFLFGAGLVVIGSKWLVESAVAIATMLGVPSLVIGLSVVAFGTSLPELVTAIASARKNVSDLGVGNILGANVANLSLILGSAAAISEITMTRTTQLINGGGLLAGMALVLCTLGGRRITRGEGLALVGFYGSYIGVLTFSTLS